MTNIPPELVLIGHSSTVTALAFSADGKTLLSGSYDQRGIRWDVQTGTMQRLLRLHKYANDVALTPDGKIVVADNGQVLDALTGQLLRKSHPCLEPLTCSPDGKMLASSTFNPEGEGWAILLSDVATGRKKWRFPCSYFQPRALAFSSDGNLLAVTGPEMQDDETLVAVTTLCDIQTGQLRQTLRGCEIASLTGVSLPPSTRLVGLTSDGKQLWDAETGQLLQRLEAEDLPSSLGFVHCVELSPDARLIAMGTYNGYVTVYDLASSRQLWQAQAHSGSLRVLAFTADGQVLATTGDDYSIRLWEATTGTPYHTLGEPRTSVETFAFHPDGEAITTLSEDGTARLWNLQAMGCERQEANSPGILRLGAPKNADTVRNLWVVSPALLPNGAEQETAPHIAAVSPDGSLVALYGYTEGYYRLHLWNVQTQTMQSILRDIAIPWTVVSFSPDNRFLAIGSEAKQIQIYDTRTGSLSRELTPPQETVGWPVRLAFSSDARTLASGHTGFEVVLWEVETGRVKRVLEAYGDVICALAFSPDGKTLAVGTAYSETVWLKSLGRGGKHRFLRGHTANLCSVSFSPDGTRIATGALDGTMRLWEATNGKLLATFVALPNGEWIIYTPEGDYTSSAGAEQYILWRVGTDLVPANTYAQCFRNLTRLLAPPSLSPSGSVGAS